MHLSHNFDDYPFELIVIDNGSIDDTYCQLQRFRALNQFLPLTSISLPSRVGPSKCWNAGIKQSKGKYIAIVGNDVIVPNHYLKRLTEKLASDSNLGVISATEFQQHPFMLKEMYDMMGMPRQLCQPLFEQMYSDKDYGRMSEMLLKGYVDFDKWNDEWYNKFKNWETEHVSASSWIIKKEVMEKLKLVDKFGENGLFDERYEVHREDSDFTHRVENLAGYKSRASGTVFVHHFGSLTVKQFESEMEGHVKKSTERFVQKWGYVPTK